MSRVGKKPIDIPKGVEVHVGHGVVQVKGPKGSLLQPIPEGISVAVAEGKVVVTRHSDEAKARALHGTTRALLANAVHGVSQGFKRELDIVGVGYKAEIKGPRELVFSLGYSHPVNFPLPEGIQASYDAKANRLTLEGIDKHLVGQVAARIRMLRPPDPYKGKGIKYASEVLKLKAGKSGA
ncbi:MAG: 50S ribosomal protein L6 [Thermoanaerobaculum sp.]|nr:50S ribosomal protein L6 [Thermoanaerobaculum sp.]MDW7967833.1 50S ribosomal protein L6 [Thermoanaerobaculum sp.]